MLGALRARWRRNPILAPIELLGLRSPLRAFFSVPEYEGASVTARRLFNLYLNRFEVIRLRTKLCSYPVKLTVEPANLCNLRCPACFTGMGQSGRRTGYMPTELFRRLLGELGDSLFQMEFANWGEPLLAKDLFTLIREAKERGISTITSTNFSTPFDREGAETLVSSGLDVLGVSIDGARQETYEKYRVRGDMHTVLRNCRLVADAKRRLGSANPRMVWDFHVFPHNVDDVEPAKVMARDLGMEISISKGWLVGDEWSPSSEWSFFLGNPKPFPCLFLWVFAVVNNDGGVAPCCGTFYQADDMGRLAAGQGDTGAPTFREVWNGDRFQKARQLYRQRRGTSEEVRSRICYDCPTTLLWEQWQSHLRDGLHPTAFRAGFTHNDSFNYFWNRRPQA